MGDSPERVWRALSYNKKTSRAGYMYFNSKERAENDKAGPSAASEYIRADIVAAKDARIAELEAALGRCAFVLRVMPDIALKVGISGTKEWDEMAGGPDLFGALDQADAALSTPDSEGGE